MENSKASVTGSSSSSSSKLGRYRAPGIPTKCWCRSAIIEKVSKTDENPFRRYYRCAFAAANKLENDPHVFKWVDEAYRNEINRLDYQVGVLEGELTGLKHGRFVVSGLDFDNECERQKLEVLGSMEERLNEAKTSMKRMMALVFCACVLLVVIVLLVKK